MKVKICGLTTIDDVLAAVDAGADMLGFNLHPPSPRYIKPQACARLIDALRKRNLSVLTIGIFVNQPIEMIGNLLDECNLDLAQLSGDEPLQALASLGERGFKALRPRRPAEVQGAVQFLAYRKRPPTFLIDAHHPGKYGGTGQTGDWALAKTFAADYPILLAGGLRPDNVHTAIEQVHPWGVDVASGVESAPGVKDVEKMRAFIAEVRQAAGEINRN